MFQLEAVPAFFNESEGRIPHELALHVQHDAPLHGWEFTEALIF